MKLKMLEGEYWYGGYVHEGINQPAAAKGIDERDVYIPKGTWTFNDETFKSTGEYRTLPCPLIVIEKIK